VRWLKAVGDMVEVEEPLVEISAAKTTREIPSPGSGALTEIIATDGETVAVRAHIATLTL
jgi:pyruvate/2-oxoglutarate dehydrogenase complex dihydrolipoamide acyltransferase (E2) component